MGVCDIFLDKKHGLPQDVVDKVREEVNAIEKDYPGVELNGKLLASIVKSAVLEKKIELGNKLSDLHFFNKLDSRIASAKTPLELAKIADNYSGSTGIGGGKNNQYSRNNLLYNVSTKSSHIINGLFANVPEFKKLPYDNILNTAVSKERFGINSGNPIAKKITTIMNTSTENLIKRMEDEGMSARFIENWGKRQTHKAGVLFKLDPDIDVAKLKWKGIVKDHFVNHLDDDVEFDIYLDKMYDKIIDESNINPSKSTGMSFGKRELKAISPEKAYEYNMLMGGDDSFDSFTSSYNNLYKRYIEYKTLGHGGMDNLKDGMSKIVNIAEHRAELSGDKKLVKQYKKISKSIKNGHIGEVVKNLDYLLNNKNDYASAWSNASRVASAGTNIVLLKNSILREVASAPIGSFASTHLLGKNSIISLGKSLGTMTSVLKGITNKKALETVIKEYGVNLSLQKVGASSVADSSGRVVLGSKSRFVRGAESLEGFHHKLNLLDSATLGNKAKSAKGAYDALSNVAKGEAIEPRLKKTLESFGIDESDIATLKRHYKKNGFIDIDKLTDDRKTFGVANKISGMINTLGNMVSPTGSLDSKIVVRTENNAVRAISDLLTKYLSIGANAVKSRLRVASMISGIDAPSGGIMGDYITFGKSAGSLKGMAVVSSTVLASIGEYYLYSAGRDLLDGKEFSDKTHKERLSQALMYGDLMMPQVSAVFQGTQGIFGGRNKSLIDAPITGAVGKFKKDFKDYGVGGGLTKGVGKLVPGLNSFYARKLTDEYIYKGLLGIQEEVEY